MEKENVNQTINFRQWESLKFVHFLEQCQDDGCPIGDVRIYDYQSASQHYCVAK